MAHAHTLAPPLARPSLDSSKYPTIDAFLKSLKRHGRTLSALFAQHATELAVLERLYYLNNNQHRPALFWQRIAEARRYSRRLRSLDVPSLVDGLRRAFYGDVTDTSSNLRKKGAWTHYPPAPTLKSFLMRLRTCNALLDKTGVRMRAIHHTLMLAMQGGAFLQLVVTLTALVARLAHLSSAMRRVLSTLQDECLHLLSSLHPTEASHNSAPPRPLLEREDIKTSSALILEPGRHTIPDSDLDVSVDVGEAISRATAVTSQLISRSTFPVPLPHYPSPAPASVPAPVLGAQQPADAANYARPSSTLGPSLRQAVIVKSKSRDRPSSSPLPAAAAEGSGEKRRKKTKKTPRDEIDDIFS